MQPFPHSVDAMGTVGAISCPERLGGPAPFGALIAVLAELKATCLKADCNRLSGNRLIDVKLGSSEGKAIICRAVARSAMCS